MAECKVQIEKCKLQSDILLHFVFCTLHLPLCIAFFLMFWSSPLRGLQASMSALTSF